MIKHEEVLWKYALEQIWDFLFCYCFIWNIDKKACPTELLWEINEIIVRELSDP